MTPEVVVVTYGRVRWKRVAGKKLLKEFFQCDSVRLATVTFGSRQNEWKWYVSRFKRGVGQEAFLDATDC